MNRSHLKIWLIITFTLAVIAIVIRSVWQIVVIPTGGTMLIFIPLIVALLGMDALFAYLVIKPEKLKSLPFSIGFTAALTAGLLAGVTHFVHFIISPLAEHFLCKVIGGLVLLSSVSGYCIIIYLVWSSRKVREDGQR
jgi:hypothetical protein